MKKLILVVLALTVFGAAGMGFVFYSFTKGAPSTSSDILVYEVRPGSTLTSVANQLADLGVITDALKFRMYARLVGRSNDLKAGEYELRYNMMPTQVLDVVTSGQSVSRSFTVSEGLNIWEISALYESQGFGSSEEFLRIVRDPDLVSELLGEDHETLEGYLFPETYGITRYTTANELIRKMVSTFKTVYAETMQGQNDFGMSRHELVTLASIIEKETGVPQERTLISGVFHNRLQKNMRLQTDPTVLYGKWDATGDLKLRITRKDLRTPTRYNTYTQGGLPHGPIANPGREALHAAVNPADTEYLFFVSRNDGTHIFTATYAEHQKAVDAWQKDPKARQGKSWRDYNRKSAD